MKCSHRARRLDGLLHGVDLQGLAREDEGDAFTAAVLAVVKGAEAALPAGYAFHDHKGERHTDIRLRWWAEGAATWRDVAASVRDPSELPEGSFDPAATPDPGPVPVAGNDLGFITFFVMVRSSPLASASGRDRPLPRPRSRPRHTGLSGGWAFLDPPES